MPIEVIKVNKKLTTVPVQFTPAFYKKAVKAYKEGDYRNLIALMEQAELDSHVSGCLQARNAGYSRDWRVTEVSQNAQDQAVRDFVNEVFKNLNMDELFEDIIDGKFKIYAVISLVWEIIDNQQVITNTAKLHQKYFRRDPKDEILKLDFGKDLRDIPADAALIIETLRNPVLLPVVRDYILKEFGVESWASFIEMFGEAFVIGYYPPGSGDDFKKEVDDAVNAIGQSARGTAPEGTKFEIHEATRNTGDQDRFVDRCDKAISITLLGHENAVAESTGFQVGENLTGYKVKREIAIKDIKFIERYIQKLIKMLVDRNYGGVTQYPKFSIDKSEPINVREHILALEGAYNQGLQIDPNDWGKVGVTILEGQKPLQKPVIPLLD